MEIKDIELSNKIIFLAENTNLTVLNIMYVLNINFHEEFKHKTNIEIEFDLKNFLLNRLGIDYENRIITLKDLFIYKPKIQDELVNHTPIEITEKTEKTKQEYKRNSKRCSHVYKNKTQCSHRCYKDTDFCFLHKSYHNKIN